MDPEVVEAVIDTLVAPIPLPVFPSLFPHLSRETALLLSKLTPPSSPGNFAPLFEAPSSEDAPAADDSKDDVPSPSLEEVASLLVIDAFIPCL